MSFDRARFMADFERVNGGSTAQPVQTSTQKSAAFDRDQFIKDFERVNGKTQTKGQAYTAPAVVQPTVKTAKDIAQQQNYEQMQRLFGKEKTQEEKMRSYLNPEYKMTKEEIAEAKEYVKQLKKEFNAGIYKNDADAMKKYDLMVNLDNKTSLRGQIAQGISGSFQPVYDIVADVALPEESKENYEKTVQQQTTAQQVQNPLAYGAGYMAGKTGQYYVAGKMLGPAVAGISKGKISGTVAGFLGDMAADVALDTIPEAIRNKHLGKTSEEIATEAVKNVAVNIAFNVGSEALIQGFKMLKNMRNSVPKETAEAMVKAVDKFDDVEKAAIAKECGFDSVKEFTESVLDLPAKVEATKPTLYYDVEKIALTAENGIKNAENESYSDKSDSIIVKLKKAIPQVAGQQIVSKVTGEEFKKGNLTLVQQVGNFFKSLGNKVSRNGFGDIIIDERGVQTDIAHGIGRAKSATFAAVPDVLKNGIQIDYQQNWKGRGYDSYVFAAPIEYAGNTAYVAAAVTKGDDNRFYLHEVVDGDGNIIYTKKQTPNVFKSGVTVQDGITATSSVYNNIPQPSENINGNNLVEKAEDSLPGSVGAMKSNPDSFFALANEHGTIPEGENPYRTVDVPTKSADGKTVSHFARTAMEAEATTNKFIPNMEELIAKGEMSHEVATDKSAVQHAQHIIENNGWEDALERWNAVAKSNKAPTKNDIALGQMLYNNAVNAGDTALAQELVIDLCVQATRAGQTVQAFRLLKQMTPSGKLYMLQKTVNQINADRLDRYKGNVEDITIPQNLADNLLKAKDSEAADVAFEKIEQHIADNIPATIGDKLNAWRYLSMLGNPRTHIRNTVGNAIFSPFKTAKDIIGAQLEKAFVKDGVKTKAVVNRKTDKSLLDYAEKDFNTNISAIKGEAKYGTNQHIQEMRKIFKMPLLEKLRKANTGALEAEDMLFLKHHYTKTLAGAMKANGITAANANTLENMQVMDALKTYATNEAQKATYRDVNVFSENVTRIKRKINEAPGASILTEGILPFAKTPANVIARGVEYSPINLARGAFNLATGGVDFSSPESVISSFKNLVKGIKGEKYTVSEALDQLASGLTGTGICALGALLASLGLVTGKEDDGDKEGDFEKLYGVQDYAMQIGGTSMTIDWAAPAAMPFFTGVELYNAMKDDDKSSTLMSQIFKIADPVFEMSMLDGLNNAIEATAYSDSKAVVSFAQAGALNYAGQFIPTLSGQFARTGNRYRTQTYVDKNKSVSPTMQRFVQQQQAKIPVLNNQLPAYRDQWGRKQDNGNVGARALQNFVSPGYWSTDKSTPVDDEIKRIYDELGEATVLPSYAAKKFNVNGETKHLTAKEYDKFAQTRGQTAYKTIEKLMTNPAYTILDTDEQAAVIEKAYGYANAKAKEAVSDYELSTQESKIDTYPAQYVIGYGAATVLKDKADAKGNKNGSTSQDEAENYLNSRNFTRQQKALLFECMCPTAKNNPYK